MASLEGKIVGTRQVDILLVVECESSDCAVRKTRGCLIGKELESRWREPAGEFLARSFSVGHSSSHVDSNSETCCSRSLRQRFF
ncbi:hypothetical protein MUO56_02685, partial [Candidatus Bathyarchaeota archaeon]|nr:hypothetical protein [Candidatus Bathyarchaeota archaeon]